MSSTKDIDIDEITNICFKTYNKIPKSGKPKEGEWTVLSCVLQRTIKSDDIKVISLGTGSKCIGRSKMSPTGEILNDSHAEVIARRGFLLYLYDNIEKAIDKQASIFNYDNLRYKLKENIEFIFYSSQMPCGDASIIPKIECEEYVGSVIDTNKHKLEDSADSDSKRLKTSSDVYRTGAKCLPDSVQDPKEPGSQYHAVAQVRTKPGRGDRTLSVSCSDKMAKWIHVGVQGSLLSLFCEPIFIKHFIFGTAVIPYSEESLKRAFFYRNSKSEIIDPLPSINGTSVAFPYRRTADIEKKPAPGSILWVNLKCPIFEVAILGKKLGATSKCCSYKFALSISKYKMYQTFLEVLKKNSDILQSLFKDVNTETIPYNEMKRKAVNYYKKWQNVRETFFKVWTVKPDMWDFCCLDLENGNER